MPMFSSYDSWKCTDPSQEGECCPMCGGHLHVERYQGLKYLSCEECGAEQDPPDEPDYDDWRAAGPN